MASGQDFFLITVSILFLAAVGLTFYYTVTAINQNSPDTSPEVQDAIKKVIGVNVTLVFFMTLLTLWFLRANPGYFMNFTVIMLHANFLIALIAVSVSVLRKLT